ncbi:uncharacterized protein LOC122509190 [Leptopilina heterotoma]|uniref:uncharacterized protein LOC122509190 n=1 Tax=Leptopilina heterotoma TaxID=63436 RepID=UPI001CA887E3|nr:uncharacterized protein LOC122509190 [Leptopilina heterotoma]
MMNLILRKVLHKDILLSKTQICLPSHYFTIADQDITRSIDEGSTHGIMKTVKKVGTVKDMTTTVREMTNREFIVTLNTILAQLLVRPQGKEVLIEGHLWKDKPLYMMNIPIMIATLVMGKSEK